MRNLILSTLSTLALLIPPLSLSAQNSFSLSLDVNGSAGNQGVTSVNVSADQVIAIQIFGKDIQNTNGIAVRFEYNAGQVTYDGFDVGNVLPNAQALPEQGTGFVEIGIASLGGQATANSGLVGTVRFRTTATFSGTAIRVVRVELSRGGRFETITLNTRVELQFQAVTPDFDGDGRVGFADFLAFGGQYGARQGDGRYDAKYDLDSDGAIGFGDFLIFGRSFGQEVSTPGGGGGGSTTNVDIPDANLRAVIADSLGKARGAPITRAEMETLTRLDAPNSDISDLTGLEFATGLTWLHLGASEEYVPGVGYPNSNAISDLSPLSGLTNLTKLFLDENRISDLSQLANLTNLRELNLRYNIIPALTPLSGLTNLDYLDITGNIISDLTPLANLTVLDILWSGSNLISDITHLSGLTNLTHLQLWDNNITDVSPLSELVSLRFVGLGHNNITDISPLSGLTKLYHLELWSNNITDVSPLSDLSSLKYLNLGGNLISDITPLSGLTALEELRLGVNLISDITPLSNLTTLTELWLRHNLISDISPLSGLTSLEYLDLENNATSDISPLANLTNLTRMSLEGNTISNLSPLSDLNSLEVLYLGSNTISDISPLSDLTNLTNLRLSFNSISDIAPLVANRGLGEGDQVDVRNNPLSATSLNTHIPVLQRRGVNVWFGAGKSAILEKETSPPRGAVMNPFGGRGPQEEEYIHRW